MKKRRGGRRAESSGKGLLTVLCVVLVLALGTLAYMILRDTGRRSRRIRRHLRRTARRAAHRRRRKKKRKNPPLRNCWRRRCRRRWMA